MKPEFYSTTECCEILHLKKVAFWHLRKRGEFPPMFVVGGKRLIKRVDFEKWMKSRERLKEKFVYPERKQPAKTADPDNVTDEIVTIVTRRFDDGRPPMYPVAELNLATIRTLSLFELSGAKSALLIAFDEIKKIEREKKKQGKG